MKYDVRYRCGHEAVVQLFGKRVDREAKLEWYENTALCPECYKAAKQAELEKEGVKVHVSAENNINDKGEPLFMVWLSGNTKPIKDEIKSAGFKWYRYAPSLLLRPEYAWRMSVPFAEIKNAIARAVELGAECVDEDGINVWECVNYQMAERASERWHKIHDGIEKPQVPEKIRGHKWNKKVYGKKGNFKVYLEGEETPLTDEEAEDIKKYVDAVEEYEEKIAAAEKAIDATTNNPSER